MKQSVYNFLQATVSYMIFESKTVRYVTCEDSIGDLTSDGEIAII